MASRHAMPKHPADAYGRAQRSALGPVEVEAMAFAKAVALLGAARGRVADFAAYRAALRFNRLLWTLVQADLTRAGNQLPADVKARLLSLSLFVDQQTVTALAAPGAARLDPLIEINRCVAGGLLGHAGRRPEAAAVQGGRDLRA